MARSQAGSGQGNDRSQQDDIGQNPREGPPGAALDPVDARQEKAAAGDAKGGGARRTGEGAAGGKRAPREHPGKRAAKYRPAPELPGQGGLAVNLVHVRQVGVEHAKATGLACRSVDRPLPYAVPTGLAVVVLAAVGLV